MLAPIKLDVHALIRTYLEALAIPRRFDYSHVPHLLFAYFEDEKYKQLPRREVRMLDKPTNRLWMMLMRSLPVATTPPPPATPPALAGSGGDRPGRPGSIPPPAIHIDPPALVQGQGR